MHKRPLLIASVAAFLTMGCDGFDVNVSEFETLCLASGGSLRSGTSNYAGDTFYNQCFCGPKHETACPQGTVCIEGGMRCASAGPRLGDECHETRNVCTEGEQTPESNAGRMMTCKNNLWSYAEECMDDQEAPVSCNAAHTACGKCLNDTQTCRDDKTLTRCVLGEAYVETCPWGCKTVDGIGQCEDKVGDACDRDETICENIGDIGLLKTCTHGVWASTSCEDVSCKGNSCGECKDKTSICENNASRKCDKGVWGPPTDCTNGCNDAGTQCKPCSNNYYQCENNASGAGVISKCIDNAWVEQDDLNPSGKSCISTHPDKDYNKILGECQNYATRCWCNSANCDDARNTLQICKGGRWEKLTDCKSCTDSNGKAACAQSQGSECKDGADIQCDGNKRVQCLNGFWKEIESCPNGCNKDSHTCIAPCEIGTMRYGIVNVFSPIIELCGPDGKWSTVSTCAITDNPVPLVCNCTDNVCITTKEGIGFTLPCNDSQISLMPTPCANGCLNQKECKP